MTSPEVKRFEKYVASSDSDNVAESSLAHRQAVQVCRGANPPLSYVDALRMVYGENDGEVEELRAQLADVENKTAIIADRYMQSEKERVELATELDRERRGKGKDSEDERQPFREVVAEFWERPQAKLLAAFLVGPLVLAMVTGTHSNPRGAMLACILISVICTWCVLMAKWTKRQYALSGFLNVVLKWALYFAVTIIAASNNFLTNITASAVCTILCYLLMISKLSEWLVESVIMRAWDSEPMRHVRECF